MDQPVEESPQGSGTGSKGAGNGGSAAGGSSGGNAAGATGGGSGASDIKIKMPIQVTIADTEEKSSMGGLKSYTAYIINVSDFGRTYQIEKRFDDFQKLHQDLTAVDRSLPPLPEKKMFSSTDAATVAERKPAFEKLLRYMLRSEDVVFEPGMLVWKYLEIPTPAMVAARYLFKSRRLSYVKQTGKLLDSKYQEEHSYRLCHESILKTNLHLLATEGMLVASGVSEPAESASASGTDVATGRRNEVELETAVIEMVRHAVGQGGQEARKCFLEEKGLETMLRLLLRIAKRPPGGSTPDERVRKVLNALIHGEGDRYSEVFANFLANGGVAIFAEFQELCAEHAPFAEFIGKALWLAWDLETQQAFLEGDSSSGAQALALLSSVFASGTRSSQIIAGLLLSSLISNGLFASNADREAKAAGGIEGLVEELITAMPTFLGASAAAGQRAQSEDIQNAEAFIVSQGRNEKAFARMISCISAPVSSDGSVAHETSGLWSACAFTLWCLVKIQPKPVRIAQLRRLAPALARCGTARVRWLAGELLLQIHVGSNTGGVPAKSPADGEEFSAEVAAQEQNAVEVTMSEQIAHTVRQLEEGLVQNREMMSQQQQLAESRQQALAIATDGSWSTDLSSSLSRLTDARNRLSDASSASQDIETTSTSALGGLTSSLQVDAQASVTDMEQALESVQELEHSYFSKRSELSECEAALQEQNGTVEQVRRDMEEADGAVSATRKQITDLEQELSSKQREAQQQRTIASSDLSSQRSQMTSEFEDVEKKLSKLREQAQKLQAGEAIDGGSPPDPAQLQDIMAKLKQQAAQLKQRRAVLQAELDRTNVDPEKAQENALRLEREAEELRDKLNFVRSSELYGLEQTHAERREVWQNESGRLQEIRHLREGLERESTELKRQVDDRWRVWQPLWSARLSRWHERAGALSQAQVHNHRFSQSVGNNWDVFREEQTARHEVLNAIARAQDTLSELSRQLVEIPDL